MTTIRRVLLIHPQDGARWRSIAVYTDSVEAILHAAGIEVQRAEAPWFNPPSLARALTSHWQTQPAIRAARIPYALPSTAARIRANGREDSIRSMMVSPGAASSLRPVTVTAPLGSGEKQWRCQRWRARRAANSGSADGRLGRALFPAGVCRPHQATLPIGPAEMPPHGRLSRARSPSLDGGSVRVMPQVL